MSHEAVDSLDAYMASFELPSRDPSMSMAQARAECNLSHAAVRKGLSVVAKNRRYQRLQQLLLEDTSEDHFFSDAMMQQRSPALFHYYVGQYQGLDRKAVDKADPPTLSSFLMDTCQRREMEARRVAEQMNWGQFHAANVKKDASRLQHLYDEDNSEEEEEEKEVQEEEEEEKDEEKVATGDAIDERRGQLVGIMSTRFLEGEDREYVNYADIDADETLDNLDAMQRDAEDRYFADERDAI